MKLSELIDKAQHIKKKLGDIPVYVAVDYEESCNECGNEESHIKDGMCESAEAMIVDGSWAFHINAHSI